MGTLTLVRHGQASFGSHDYDRLSALGKQQCRRLGEYLRARGARFDAVLRGSLKRHEQSLDALLDGLATPHEVLVFPGLDEYDSHAVIRTVHSGELAAPKSPEEYRGHFRLLREGLTRWVRGEVSPQGMPSFAEFCAGVDEVLDHVKRYPGDVLLVSSGGPIATAVTRVLGAPAETLIELNLRIRNSALTEFAVTPRRLMLHSFNGLPHLDGPEYAGWVTYT